MKKLIPLVLVVWAVALVGCTTTTETTTTSTTTKQQSPNASVDPTLYSNRPSPTMERGPR